MSSYSDYAEAVGRLMQQQGDISARAELAKGNARAQAQANNAAGWGNAVNQITHTLTNIPAQQAQAKELQLREQEQQLRNQALQGQVKAQEQQRITSQQADQIVAKFPKNPDKTYNIPELQQQFTVAGIPIDTQKRYLDVFESMNGIVKSFNDSKITHAADAAHVLLQQHPPGEPWSWSGVQLSAAGLKPTGLVSDEDQKLIDQAAESGANPEAFLKAMRDKSEKYKDYDKRTAETAKAQSEAQREALITAGTGPTGITAKDQATLDAAAGTARTAAADKVADNLRADDAAKRLAAAQAETIRHNRATEAAAKAGGASDPLVPIIDPKTGKSILVPRSEAAYKQPANAREQGRPVTSGDANKVAELDNSLSDLATLTKEIPPGETGPLAQATAALPNFVTAWTGIGATAKAKQAVIDRVKQVIGKALEGGVLRKEDEYKYIKILPTIGDVPSVVEAKLAGLKTAIQNKRSILLDSLADAGYDTSKFTQRSPAGVPDLAGLTAGNARQFSSGPFAGQTWTIKDGQPVRVK